MKRNTYIIFLLGLFLQATLLSQPKALIDFRVFDLPNELAQYEFYYEIDVNHLSANPKDTLAQSYQVEIIVELLQDTALYGFDKLLCESPLMNRQQEHKFLFSHTIIAKHQDYDIVISMKDPRSGKSNIINTFYQRTDSQKPLLSKPLVVHKTDSSQQGLLNKSGLSLSPDLYRIRTKAEQQLSIYQEVSFNDSVEEIYLVRYTLHNDQGNLLLQQMRKLNAKDQKTHALLINFPCSKLEEKGNYYVKSSLYNREMEVLRQDSIDFFFLIRKKLQSINELIQNQSFISYVNNTDTLVDYINSLEPISSDAEQQRILKQSSFLPSDSSKKAFFYQFWIERDGERPDRAWLDYREEVKKVNRAFSTPIRRGYETDRGRIMLKYGAPNTISDRPNEPEAYPYQIWHYHRLGKYNDVRFVFYTRDLVTNDYELLHAEMPGEIKNPQWRVVLNNRTQTGNTFDMTNPGNTHGSRSDDFFTNPR